ncbi:glycosyltransferase family 4 protein [Lysobacter capsici]|nr:glycosyltransferase family 4 protein [Lysobacter capsici]
MTAMDALAHADRRPLKVLMLGWELPPAITGGLGVACEGLLRGIGALGGIGVDFLLPASPGIRGDYPAAVRIVELDGCEDPRVGARAQGAYIAYREKAARYAAATLRALPGLGDFDLIHAHDWLTFEAALAIKRATGRPLVVHVHSTEHDRAGEHRTNPVIAELERLGMQAADRIVAVSRYTGHGLVRNYGQSADRIDVVYNAGRSRQADPPPATTPADGCVCFIGRITEQKGPEAFVEAALRIRERVPDARFEMAGDGNLLPLMRSLVRALGLSEAFSFPGFIDREEVTRLLARSRVLVMPSLSEPFGLVALEAIEAGVPVVLSRNCGLAERVPSAICVDPDDIDAIADAAIGLLTDPARARARALAAAREAADLDWTRSAAALKQVYGVALDTATRQRIPLATC